MTARRHKINDFSLFNLKLSGENIVLVAVLFFALLMNQETSAQVRATGHVFAEIVEPTALTARAANDHFISENEVKQNEELLLAEIKLSGGSNLNIDVSVQSTALEAENGERFFFDAFACPECSENQSKFLTGEKTYTLKGTPRDIPGSKHKKRLTGRYRVTFMYN